MRRPSGVIFDYGDTVLKAESQDALAGNRRLLEFATNDPRVSAEEVQAVADEIYSEIVKVQLQTQTEFSAENFDRLLYESLGITLSITPLEMAREFRRVAIKHKPAPGIRDILRTLKSHRIKAGIVSNTMFTGDILREELASHGLARYFDFIISSGDFGFRKPNRRIFTLAARKMGFGPDEIWVAGDRLDYDIAGAVNSGMFPVWYNPEGKRRDGDYQCLEIRHWHELQDKIENLCRGEQRRRREVDDGA